jgi:cardiolipin synthase
MSRSINRIVPSLRGHVLRSGAAVVSRNHNSIRRSLSGRGDAFEPAPVDGRRAIDSALRGRLLDFDRGIIALTDAQLAAATPADKVALLKKLLSVSDGLGGAIASRVFGGGGGVLQPSWLPSSLKAKQEAILRILGTAQTPAAFDQLVSRVGRSALEAALTGEHRAALDAAFALSSKRTPGDWAGYQQYLDEVTGTRSSGKNKLRFLLDGAEFLSEFHPAIDAEKELIHITVFQLQPDEVGNTLADKLIARAQAGVKVRVLADQFGSTARNGAQANALFDRMRAGGCEVIVNPRPISCEHLDHRKIYLFGTELAFTGGMNLGHHYQVEWHDQQTRVEGPAVRELHQAFLARWEAEGGKVSEEERARLLASKPEHPQGIETRVIPHEGNGVDRNIKYSYLKAIRTAEKSIRIADPYFSDEEVFSALCDAARDGVGVRLFFPEGNNQKPLKLAAQSHYDELIKAGVEVYEYHGDGEQPRMSHLKVATFDGKLTTLGSSNLDERSLAYNDELNLSIVNGTFAAEVNERLFDADVSRSKRITEVPQGVLHRVARLATPYL